MSSRRSLVVQLFFALLLVFAQQQAVLHALEHDFERIHSTSKDATHHEDAFCAKCLAVAHLDQFDGVGVVALPVSSYAPVRVAAATGAVAPPTFVGVYHSRAPPLFS
jgi:hypothetical protein